MVQEKVNKMTIKEFFEADFRDFEEIKIYKNNDNTDDNLIIHSLTSSLVVDFSKSSLCLQKFNLSFLSLNTAHEVSHE